MLLNRPAVIQSGVSCALVGSGAMAMAEPAALWKDGRASGRRNSANDAEGVIGRHAALHAVWLAPMMGIA